MTGILQEIFIYLLAAVVAVPLAKRMGLGSVLGYLVAGVVIGPVLGVVGSESTTIQHYAEFGVVMMLFIVGLELEPRMLWRMRTQLLGLGGLQIALTAGAFTYGGIFLGLDWRSAVATGLLLSLSSTAIVLQTFQEKQLGKTEGGRSAFSVLLMQDIAVIPMLALIPLLAIPELLSHGGASTEAAGHEEMSLVHNLSGPVYAGVLLAAVAAVVLAGHFLSRPLFRFIAAAGLRESFTAAALLLVIGIAVLMGLVGLSPALGTFLAGVVMANSEFRHELETDIEPFKGLLLGLFFITVGAGVQFPVLTEKPALIAGLVCAVIVVKALVLFTLALVFRVRRSDGWLFTLSLAQAGEFGFVLLSFSSQNRVLAPELVPILSLVVALSMFLTPLLFICFERLVLPRYEQRVNDRAADAIAEQAPVLIAGIGRFGQIVNRLLRASGIPTVVLDKQPQQIDNMRQVNIRSYFGDATRPDLLHAAGAERAGLFVIAIDEREEALVLARYLKHAYPQLKVLARAFDRGHYYALQEAGVDFVVSETYYSALELGKAALMACGDEAERAEERVTMFDSVEARARAALYEQWQGKSESERFGRNFQTLFIELEETLKVQLQAVEGAPEAAGEKSAGAK